MQISTLVQWDHITAPVSWRRFDASARQEFESFCASHGIDHQLLVYVDEELPSRAANPSLAEHLRMLGFPGAAVAAVEEDDQNEDVCASFLVRSVAEREQFWAAWDAAEKKIDDMLWEGFLGGALRKNISVRIAGGMVRRALVAKFMDREATEALRVKLNPIVG